MSKEWFSGQILGEDLEAKGAAWKLIYLLAIFLALGMVTAAWADTYSMVDQNGKLTLTNEPCKQGPWFKDWRAAKWVFQGKEYDACWIGQEDLIVVLDSVGVVTTHRPHRFRKDEAV